MTSPSRKSIGTDADTDALDFTPYVQTLADIAATGNTPLTIGVFGTWGSGKTPLMKMVKKHLPDDFTVAWFDAWKYDKEETLWRAFLLCALTALKDSVKVQGKPTEEFEKMQSLLYRGLEVEKVGCVNIDLTKLGGAFAKGAVNLSLSFIPGGEVLKKLVETFQSQAGESLNEATEAISRERTKSTSSRFNSLSSFRINLQISLRHTSPQSALSFLWMT